MVLHEAGAPQDVGPGAAQVVRVDAGKARRRGLLDPDVRGEEVATELRQLVDALSAELDPLVFDQPARELGARIFHFLAAVGLLHRQQHPRLDRDQQRGHQQVFGSEFEIVAADLVDVGEVLARDLGHRNVEDVEVLPTDQVQQHVQRALEGVEENLQGVGRNVQILRQPQHRLAVQAREDLQLQLLGSVGSRSGFSRIGRIDLRPGGQGAQV